MLSLGLGPELIYVIPGNLSSFLLSLLPVFFKVGTMGKKTGYVRKHMGGEGIASLSHEIVDVP